MSRAFQGFNNPQNLLPFFSKSFFNWGNHNWLYPCRLYCNLSTGIPRPSSIRKINMLRALFLWTDAKKLMLLTGVSNTYTNNFYFGLQKSTKTLPSFPHFSPEYFWKHLWMHFHKSRLSLVPCVICFLAHTEFPNTVVNGNGHWN